jgi:hypothetical protein
VYSRVLSTMAVMFHSRSGYRGLLVHKEAPEQDLCEYFRSHSTSRSIFISHPNLDALSSVVQVPTVSLNDKVRKHRAYPQGVKSKDRINHRESAK